MKVRCFKTEQKGQVLYHGAIPAGELIKRAKADPWSPANADGYQRPLQPRRVREATRYLVEQEGVFPTSVLLSVRSKSLSFHAYGGNGFGELEIPDKVKVATIDGQHRLAGLSTAIEQGHKQFEDYSVPVCIVPNPELFDEMRMFYIVNSRQKRVPTDIANRLLEKAFKEKGKRFLQEHEAHDSDAVNKSLAVETVDLLREQCPAWTGMIVRPGEAPPGPQAVKSQTIISSLLRVALKDRLVNRRAQDPASFTQMLCRYWCAIKRKFPEAFAEPGEHSIQRTPGLYSLHAILPDVLELCQEDHDFSEDKMFDILNHMDIDSSFWHRQEGDPLTLGTGQKSLRLLADELRDKLPALELA